MRRPEGEPPCGEPHKAGIAGRRESEARRKGGTRRGQAPGRSPEYPGLTGPAAKGGPDAPTGGDAYPAAAEQAHAEAKRAHRQPPLSMFRDRRYRSGRAFSLGKFPWCSRTDGISRWSAQIE